jgi:hypothetical protein
MASLRQYGNENLLSLRYNETLDVTSDRVNVHQGVDYCRSAARHRRH